jgi:hypothetical protein
MGVYRPPLRRAENYAAGYTGDIWDAQGVEVLRKIRGLAGLELKVRQLAPFIGDFSANDVTYLFCHTPMHETKDEEKLDAVFGKLGCLYPPRWFDHEVIKEFQATLQRELRQGKYEDGSESGKSSDSSILSEHSDGEFEVEWGLFYS